MKTIFLTKAPNVYNTEKDEDNFEVGIQQSVGIKPKIKTKFLTDNSGDHWEEGMTHTFGIKPEIKNKFLTLAHNAYHADRLIGGKTI